MVANFEGSSRNIHVFLVYMWMFYSWSGLWNMSGQNYQSCWKPAYGKVSGNVLSQLLLIYLFFTAIWWSITSGNEKTFGKTVTSGSIEISPISSREMYRLLFQMELINGKSFTVTKVIKTFVSATSARQLTNFTLFSMVNDYLIGLSNTTLDFDCIQHVSNALLVTFTDMDGIEVIPLFSMRAGIDQDNVPRKRTT